MVNLNVSDIFNPLRTASPLLKSLLVAVRHPNSPAHDLRFSVPWKPLGPASQPGSVALTLARPRVEGDRRDTSGSVCGDCPPVARMPMITRWESTPIATMA